MYFYKIITKVNADELKGKVVLLRGSLNTPVIDEKIVDTYRIKRNFDTIRFLQDAGAKIILIGHLGKGKEDESLQIVSNFISDYIKHKFIKEKDFKKIKEEIQKMENKEMLLLENLRFFPGEKENDSVFAKKLSSLGDLYVFDAFDVSHRKNASVNLLPKQIQTYTGIQFNKEIKELKKAQKPKQPAGLVFGGAKMETKIEIVKKLLSVYDFVFVGGIIANTLLSKKYNVGSSVVDESVDISHLINNKKIILPVDVTVLNDKNEHFIKEINKICDNEKIVDIGHKTVEILKQKIEKTKSVLWNGPVGWYERGFINHSVSVAKTLTSSKNIYSIAGGGDTIACIKASGTINDWSFLSTGGGAMLYFLANDDLALPKTEDSDL